MFKYGMDTVTELRFLSFTHKIEKRDEQWMDIMLQPELADTTPVPDDIIDFSIWVICTHAGTIVQILPQDEDCDCEYNFTPFEKEQITVYINSEPVQAMIANLSAL
ncbi:hypothetical protein ACX1C1_19300 [Paenibacillus sp. strain BS8-2]